MAHFVYPVGTNGTYSAQTTFVAARSGQQPAYGSAAPRANQDYENYPAAQATTQYTYSTRSQVPAVSYDHPQHSARYQSAPPGTAFTAAESQYQGAGYANQRATNPHKPQDGSAHQGYVYSTPVSTSSTYQDYSSTYDPSTTQSAFTAYEAAVYSAAASSIYQHQRKQHAVKSLGAGGWGAKKQTPKAPKAPKPPPQIHYCDVCKISCHGPQTYRAHLEGGKHKKKEAAASGPAPPPAPSKGSKAKGPPPMLKCELCDITCTSVDVYTAHIRGSKHERVVKLHTQMGRPIPSTEPIILTPPTPPPSSVSLTSTTHTSVSSAAAGGKMATGVSSTADSAAAIIRRVAPKIPFVGGSNLKSTNIGAQTVSNGVKDGEQFNISSENDIAPVGQEFVQDVLNDSGKFVNFTCTLCECIFNDIHAKELHLKGRRHRQQYKKKVDPSFQVEKPGGKQRKEDTQPKRKEPPITQIRMEEDAPLEGEKQTGRLPLGQKGVAEPESSYMAPEEPRKPESSEDRHVNAKHTAIYPKEAELMAVQSMVCACERALKLVSDSLAQSDGPKPGDVTAKEMNQKENDAGTGNKQQEGDGGEGRALKGVMRVGLLAKGLLLQGNLHVQMVVLCAGKPTVTLLRKVAQNLSLQLKAVSNSQYEVSPCVEEASIVVIAANDPHPSCTITLTSPAMKEPVQGKRDPPGVLNRQKCLEALAALRHAKWFQARATGLPSCVVVLRILRDLCQRDPVWANLDQWSLELLVEKTLSSAGRSMNPGEALRRVFECISSGLFLQDGPGLCDPCEKEPRDTLAALTLQMREDLVTSAQHALRLMAFRQSHKVLNMEPLVPKFKRRPFTNRKRKLNDSSEASEDAAKKEKKEEKEENKEEETKTDAT